jgi:hypothetical protein
MVRTKNRHGTGHMHGGDGATVASKSDMPKSDLDALAAARVAAVRAICKKNGKKTYAAPNGLGE